ncbi:MAG: four helix bundle protein [Candidatus Levybacteria bacterium]|nr:four helix bundle protein [Candidatus Levybacteria bacterium]
MGNGKIKSFTDLIAWQEGHKLVLFIYKIVAAFTRTEYSLVDQMKRCAASITSNIAEGFSRKSKKEKMQFYYMALGSTTELQNQLVISRDLRFLSVKDFDALAQQAIRLHKLINGLIKSSESYT